MRSRGTVKWFDFLHGFGVIHRDLGESDCLVRHSAVRGSLHHALTMGDRVEFDVVQDAAGAVARDVIRLGVGFIPLTPKAV